MGSGTTGDSGQCGRMFGYEFMETGMVQYGIRIDLSRYRQHEIRKEDSEFSLEEILGRFREFELSDHG